MIPALRRAKGAAATGKAEHGAGIEMGRNGSQAESLSAYSPRTVVLQKRTDEQELQTHPYSILSGIY